MTLTFNLPGYPYPKLADFRFLIPQLFIVYSVCILKYSYRHYSGLLLWNSDTPSNVTVRTDAAQLNAVGDLTTNDVQLFF